jgi:hypothetical protein
MRGRYLVLGVAVFALGVAERSSDACECLPAVRVSPAPGSESVPTNAELFRSTNGPSVVTLVGGGESAQISLQQLTCGGYRYQTTLDLLPNTTYEVLQYDPPEVLTSFTTGGGPDDTPPLETGNFGSPYGDDCRIFTALEPGDEYCWEVRARDLAGNEGPPARRCATVMQCASSDSIGNLTNCALPSTGGCALGPRDLAPGTVCLLCAVACALALRRPRRR